MYHLKRIEYIDIAKAIGIFIVLWSHTGAEKGMMTYLGGVMIPVFFIVSGITYKKKYTLIPSLIKKFKRLIIPHFIFSLLLLIAFKAFDLIDFVGVFYSRYSLYPLYVKDNFYFFHSAPSPIWFLTAMFMAYVVFEIYREYNIKPLFVYFISIVLCVVLDKMPILFPWSIDTCFLFSLFIYIGYKYSYQIQNVTRKKIVLVVCVYILSCYINGYCNLSVREYGYSCMLVVISGITGTMLIIYISKMIEKTKLMGMFTCIGKHSLAIFCMQPIAIRLCNKLMFESNLLSYNQATIFGVAIIKVVVACIIGIVISLLMKRFLPFIKI